jgi:hypothetical protein
LFVNFLIFSDSDGGVSESQSHRSHKTSFTSDDGRHNAMSPQNRTMSPKDQDCKLITDVKALIFFIES